MMQRKEIKRLETEKERMEVEEKEEIERAEQERRNEEVRHFERGSDGVDVSVQSGSKRKRGEASEMHGRGEDTKEKKARVAETSFWVPGVEERINKGKGGFGREKSQAKLTPVCPGSGEEEGSIHGFSLKGLVSVQFTEEENAQTGGGEKEKVRVCPSCKKKLSNSSKAMLGLAQGCGHVLCGVCCGKFMEAGSARCFVCEADLSGGRRKGEEKKGKNKKLGELVEISCEGTGFAGGGANVTKKEGVSFQC